MKRKSFASLAVAAVLLFATIAQLQGTWRTFPSLGEPVAAQPPPGQRGPRTDLVRHKVTRSPAAQLVEMTLGAPTGSDMWMGMIRPTDVDEMDAQGKSISSRSMHHFGEFGFNYRNPPLDDVNFRHALAHLMPKEEIVGTLFNFITILVSTPVPPAQGYWYNQYVDPHPYSRTEAEDILNAAGYQKVGGVWKMPDLSDMPTLRVYVPLEIVAPTSYTIGTMFIDECQAIGLTNLSLEPMDYSTYIDLVFDDWDFDIFWVSWNLGRFPTHLYSFFHSSNNFKGSNNPYGINYPDLDSEIETFYYGLDHPAKIAAAKTCQELVMGGTTIDELAKPAQPERSQAIPLIPVYSRNTYDTQQPDLRGAVNMYGEGIDNIWTHMNIYWDTPNEYRPGTNERMVVPILEEFPETLNPMSASTPYAWTMLDPTFDGLLATNPTTLRDIPWLATSWSYAAEPGGMYIEFNLRTTDSGGNPITWQDGDPIAASDVKFAWDFLADNGISRYWDDMKFYLGADIVGNEITAHMSTTSQWLVYALAETALMVPEQVWSPWDGQPTPDIEAWDPSAVAGPGGLPTKVYGTGPFILQHSTLFMSTQGYGDLDANRNYWKTTAEMQGLITEMFHSAGDVDYDGVVGLEDIARISRAYGTSPGYPLWDPDADITGDGYIDIDDLGTCSKYFGETRTVPLSLPDGSQAPTPIVYVDPPLVTGVGGTFAVNIYIEQAINVYAWEFDLSYSPDVLSVVDINEGDFLAAAGSTFFTAFESARGQHRAMGSLLGYVPGVNGEGILATVTFNVLEEGESPIDIERMRLLDPDLNGIGRTTVDGYYRYYAADVSVYPVAIIGPPPKIGETFTVGIDVSDVNDLYTWQAGMTFNATVLEALSIEEGEFLKRAGVTTLWTPGTINNTLGEISYSACSLTGPTPGVSGSGQLMNITFRVKESGTSALNLTDVLLLDSNLVEITPVKITHGYVEINVQDIAILDVGIPYTSTIYLYVNEVIPLWGYWAEIGTSPYLDAIGDGSYIEGNDYCQLSDGYGFENITLGPMDKIMNVTLEGYTRADTTNIDMDVYVWTPEDYQFNYTGSLWGDTDWSWKSPRWETNPVSTLVPSIKTEAGLNEFSVLVHYWTPDGLPAGNADIDALRLKVTIESLKPIVTEEVYPTWTVPLNIGVVVENQGTATETFNVTLYADSNAIETKPVILAAGDNTTVVFNWNLTGVAEGIYTIRAEASVLYGETDTADNVFISGTVKVKHPGDANDDGILNAYDLGILAQAWGTQVGDPLYDPRADFNGDGVIDTQDHDILKAYWP